jgi:hypothetical protein
MLLYYNSQFALHMFTAFWCLLHKTDEKSLSASLSHTSVRQLQQYKALLILEQVSTQHTTNFSNVGLGLKRIILITNNIKRKIYEKVKKI